MHGYGAREVQRLQDQASSLVELLYADTVHTVGARGSAKAQIGDDPSQALTLAAPASVSR